jgi:hypothetical protein
MDEYPKEILDQCDQIKKSYLASKIYLYQQLKNIYENNLSHLRIHTNGNFYNKIALIEFREELIKHNINYTATYDPDDDMDCGFHFWRPSWNFNFKNPSELEHVIHKIQPPRRSKRLQNKSKK